MCETTLPSVVITTTSPACCEFKMDLMSGCLLRTDENPLASVEKHVRVAGSVTPTESAMPFATDADPGGLGGVSRVV